MNYLLYILLGLVPSFIWLAFYLRKDHHPEPNSMVLKIFTWGMLLAPLAIILEFLLIWILNPGASPWEVISGAAQDGFWIILVSATLIPATVEELLKYLIIKAKVLKHSEFDEPTDAMLYCIIAALGFAAIENLLVLSNKMPALPLRETLTTILLRFLGATFVHALAAAIVGFWLAWGLLHLEKRKIFVLLGLSTAIAFHAAYNYLIFTISLPKQDDPRQQILFRITVILLVSAGLAVSAGFRKLKKQQSICKI
jgi:RsiW-degrading membrane proteinase PrsW (M82 family)